jgi:hypothetical protein
MLFLSFVPQMIEQYRADILGDNVQLADTCSTPKVQDNPVYSAQSEPASLQHPSTCPILGQVGNLDAMVHL